MLVLGANVDVGGDRRGVETDGILDVDRHQLTRQLGQNAHAARAAQNHRLTAVGRHGLTQTATRAHQYVRVGNERANGEIKPLQAGGWALEIAMVKGQHDGVTALGLEDTRQAVLHAPIERDGTTHRERLDLHRLIQSEILAFSHVVQIGHGVLQWAAGVCNQQHQSFK